MNNFSKLFMILNEVVQFDFAAVWLGGTGVQNPSMLAPGTGASAMRARRWIDSEATQTTAGRRAPERGTERQSGAMRARVDNARQGDETRDRAEQHAPGRSNTRQSVTKGHRRTRAR